MRTKPLITLLVVALLGSLVMPAFAEASAVRTIAAYQEDDDGHPVANAIGLLVLVGLIWLGYDSLKTSSYNKKVEAYLDENPHVSSRIEQGLRQKRLVVGMDEDAVKIVWGSPSRINRSTYAWGVSEQWVYGAGVPRKYAYLTNGILDSFQD